MTALSQQPATFSIHETTLIVPHATIVPFRSYRSGIRGDPTSPPFSQLDCYTQHNLWHQGSMGRTPVEGGGKAGGGRLGTRAGSRVGSRHLSSRGAGVGLSSATTSLCTSEDRTRSISRSLPVPMVMTKASQPVAMASLEGEGSKKPPLDFMKSLFKPYKVSSAFVRFATFRVFFLFSCCTFHCSHTTTCTRIRSITRRRISYQCSHQHYVSSSLVVVFCWLQDYLAPLV